MRRQREETSDSQIPRPNKNHHHNRHHQHQKRHSSSSSHQKNNRNTNDNNVANRNGSGSNAQEDRLQLMRSVRERVVEDPKQANYVEPLHTSGGCGCLVKYGFKPKDPAMLLKVTKDADFDNADPSKVRIVAIPWDAKKITLKTFMNFCLSCKVLQQVEFSASQFTPSLGAAELYQLAAKHPWIEAIQCHGVDMDYRKMCDLLPRWKHVDPRDSNQAQWTFSMCSDIHKLLKIDDTHPDLSFDL